MHDRELLRAADLRASVGVYEIDLAERIADPVPVITLDGMTVCSRGNLSAIVGEAKSKKTFLCSALVGGVLSSCGYMGFDPHPCSVVWIDTEQAEAHVHRVVARTHRMAALDTDRNHERLHVLSLRELEPAARAGKAYEAIELYRPDLVVIDGIADLQYNTNDLEESERIVTELMRLSTLYCTHILCVLHTNPNSERRADTWVRRSSARPRRSSMSTAWGRCRSSSRSSAATSPSSASLSAWATMRCRCCATCPPSRASIRS